MIEKLRSRLSDLDDITEAVRSKLTHRDAGQLDAHALARLLLTVDAAVTKMFKLGSELGPDLFESKESA